MIVNQGITMVWGNKSRNFPCPIFHDVMITNWGPGLEGKYDVIPWPKDRIISWHTNDRRWNKLKTINQNIFGQWLISKLISAELIQNPGPCQHVLLTDCMADNFEVVQITALVASNLTISNMPFPLNIGIQDTPIKDS